jgi:hypothetical protein
MDKFNTNVEDHKGHSDGYQLCNISTEGITICLNVLSRLILV